MAELRKHPRHLYFAVENEEVFSVYHTIRRERTMHVTTVPGLKDSPRLSPEEVTEIENKLK